jgi:hypothetical protein
LLLNQLRSRPITASTPFALLEDTFQLLGAPPHPLAVDGEQLGHGLPRRQISILELRVLVTAPAASGDLQRTVIGAVLDRIHRQRATWVVVLGGLLLPGLQCLAEQLTISAQRRADEIEAELLTCLLTATHRPPHQAHRFAMYLLHLQQAPTQGSENSPRPPIW